MRMKNKKDSDAVTRLAHIEQRKAAKARQRKSPNIDREKPIKVERQRMLIYCEGKNTEPSYFNQFRMPTIEVKCFGEGRNTLSLVKHAIVLRDQATALEKSYDQIWCVFDRDPATTNNSGHTPENFNEAIGLARKENIRVAYSNQAFEYWLLLHFNDHQGGPMPRSDYYGILNNYLLSFGCKYDGQSSKIVTSDIFDVLEAIDAKTGKQRRVLACERASRIYNRFDHVNPAQEESSTTVFQLVSLLVD